MPSYPAGWLKFSSPLFRVMSSAEIQTRLDYAEDFLDQLYRSGTNGAVFSEYPGMPLTIVVKKKNDPSWTDQYSPRQNGMYHVPTEWGMYWNRVCLQGFYLRKGLGLPPIFLNAESWDYHFVGDNNYIDHYSFEVDDNPETIWYPSNYYEPHFRVTLDYNTNGTTDLKIYLLDFRDDQKKVDVYLGDTFLGTIDDATARSESTPWYSVTTAAWKTWGSGRYTIRHGIKMASHMYSGRNDTVKANALADFANDEGFVQDLYDPFFNVVNSDNNWLVEKGSWWDAEKGIDFQSNALPHGLDPYRYAYESKVVASGARAVNQTMSLTASVLGFLNVNIFNFFGRMPDVILRSTLRALHAPQIANLMLGIDMNSSGPFARTDHLIAGLSGDTARIWKNFLSQMLYARVAQALNILLNTGDLDYRYPDLDRISIDNKGNLHMHDGGTTTPRLIARETEESWNGIGYSTWQAPGFLSMFSKDFGDGVAYYTNPIAIFLTVAGYKYNDVWSKARADRLFDTVMSGIQWGVHGSTATRTGVHEGQPTLFGKQQLDEYEIFRRPQFAGGCIAVWNAGRSGSYDFGFNHGGTFGLMETMEPDPMNSPMEYPDLIPCNAESSLMYHQALRTYLYHKHGITHGNVSTIPGA